MAQIGLKNFYYSLMTKEETATEAPTYGAMKRVIGINSIDISPTINKATLYGDDIALATASALGEISVTIDVADFPLEDLAALLGHSIVDGMMVSKGSDSAPYCAIAFESEKHNGEIRYMKLLKGKFSESQENINTRGNSIEYQIPQITATFVSRANDSVWRYMKDSSDTGVASTWYTSMDRT